MVRVLQRDFERMKKNGFKFLLLPSAFLPHPGSCRKVSDEEKGLV
jgi:hypothetical protein